MSLRARASTCAAAAMALVGACAPVARATRESPARGGGPASAGCGVCAAYGAPRSAGVVGATAITELSGLAASRARPGVYFAHNDSGDGPRFFALGRGGEALGEYTLAGATAVDWEDIAVGPCPAGSCVYIADIGSAGRARQDFAIYRVTEPAVDPAHPAAAHVRVAWERFAFAYPDGAHDAEAMFVHPRTGDVYVLTKSLGASGVYRLPAPLVAAAQTTATRVATLRVSAGFLRLVTAADVHPCEARVLVRTYDRLLEFSAPAGAPFDAVFTASPVELPVASERQGEAAGYTSDGRGYVTASEGAAPEFHVVGCR